MADNTVRGRFVWHELMTPDTASAQAFYTKVLGWKTQPWEEDPSYTMFVAASGPLGGTAESSGESHWLTYIRTDDIEATVAKARSLGASVSKEITDMPNGGKYAVLNDPQGAEFGVYSSPAEPEPERAAKRGEYSWHELATTDYRAAFDFYSKLFGWEAAGEHDMGGELGKYFMFGRKDAPVGGMFNRTPDMPGGPSWLGYVRVKDVQQAVKKVKAAGGTLLAGPMEVPGGDWIAQFIDPRGAMFAVHTVAADLQTAAASTDAKVEPAAAADASAAAEPKPKKAAASAAATSSASTAKSSGTKATAPAKKSKKSKQSAKKVAKKAAKKKTSKAVSKRAKSKSTKKRGAAARGSKRPARKAAKAKKSTKRSGGKKKAVKRARKAK